MKRTVAPLACLIAFSVALPAYAKEKTDVKKAAATAPSAPTPSAPWSAKMQAMYTTLTELLTDVTSDSRFADPKNKKAILKNADAIATLAHDLTKKSIAPDSDPSLALIGDLLHRQAKSAASALRQGDRTYARSILRTLPSYCIACHTRNASGTEFKSLPLEPASGTLTALERAEFYAATRQFDRASDALAPLLKPTAGGSARDAVEWQRAVETALAISVRVKKDAAKTGEIVDQIVGAADAPAFMKADAKAWKVSVDEWKKESASATATPKTVEGLRERALALMKKARSLQEYPMDRTADIDYLRASAAAHDLLQATKDPASTADALLLAGLSYEVLAPLRTENLHELYYESCIRKSPHSNTALLCFHRVEASVILGYTGSGGTNVPADVRAHLNELRALSKPDAGKITAPKEDPLPKI